MMIQQGKGIHCWQRCKPRKLIADIVAARIGRNGRAVRWAKVRLEDLSRGCRSKCEADGLQLG